jgi:membrane protein implicated in regulation of membrane protease activity
MENNFYYWLMLGLFFLLVELMNPGLFFFFSFFLGAVGAAVLALKNSSLLAQIGVFFAVFISVFSVLCLWFSRKQYRTLRHNAKTNVAALQGKRAVVLEEIKPFKQGLIKVGGELWSARARDNEWCVQGSVVEIIDVIGCHCVVRLVS